MRTHELKVWPEYFAALLDGSKTFELRKNDRGFQVGDTLWLREWDGGGPGQGYVYTGRESRRVVSYVLNLDEAPWDTKTRGYAILGLRSGEA